MTWDVYQIVHVATGISYTCMSRVPEKAWTTQRSELRNDKHCNPDFQAAWDFYRPSDFAMVVVESGLDEIAACESVRRIVAEARARDATFNMGPGIKSERRLAPPKRRDRWGSQKPKRRVVVAGVAYESLSEAARRFGVNPSAIQKRVESTRWPDYQYADAG